MRTETLNRQSTNRLVASRSVRRQKRKKSEETGTGKEKQQLKEKTPPCTRCILTPPLPSPLCPATATRLIRHGLGAYGQQPVLPGQGFDGLLLRVNAHEADVGGQHHVRGGLEEVEVGRGQTPRPCDCVTAVRRRAAR